MPQDARTLGSLAVQLASEGRWREARLQFAAVYQRYPSSDLAPKAREMYQWPDQAFAIQCGAFRDRSGAQKLANKLKRSGLDARVETRPRSGEVLYVVYVGRYPQYRGAQEALRAIRRYVSDALIVP